MQTYWITGASSGIGQALAQELNSHGHQVILSSRNGAKLEALRSSLKYPDRARVLSFDLADTEKSQSLVDAAWNLFGTIDVVILNAGLAQRSLVQDSSLEVYRKLMEVNYLGNISITHFLLKKFLLKNHGHFVVISSLVGKFGTPYRSGYSASKHALHGHYDSLRAEMMMQNKSIFVSLICPGFVATDISYNALGGSGNPTGLYDEANARGMSPQQFAQRAYPLIQSKKLEAYIGGKEVWGVYLKRFLPDFFARKIAKAKVR
jgi:dehydrogenase/reductase SDR family member 7B